MSAIIPADTKARIIAQAIPRLANGESTDAIAIEHGITGRTLRYWLVSDEQAIEARTAFLADKLMSAAEAIDSSEDQFPLARARESFRAWSFLAERRLPSMFGQRQEIHHTHDISDDLRAMSERKRLKQHTIDSANVLDVVPNDPNES